MSFDRFPMTTLSETLKARLQSEEERMIFNPREFGYKYPVQPEVIRADVARINAEYAKRQEAHRPTPAGTAKLVVEIVDRMALVRPIVDRELLQKALVNEFEAIFTTTWARGYDDGQDQLKRDVEDLFADDEDGD